MTLALRYAMIEVVSRKFLVLLKLLNIEPLQQNRELFSEFFEGGQPHGLPPKKTARSSGRNQERRTCVFAQCLLVGEEVQGEVGSNFCFQGMETGLWQLRAKAFSFV